MKYIVLREFVQIQVIAQINNHNVLINLRKCVESLTHDNGMRQHGAIDLARGNWRERGRASELKKKIENNELN